MANKKVIIAISTTTNTSGTDKAKQSLESIEREKKKIEDAERIRADREIARAKRKQEADEKALGVTQRRAEREARYAVETAEKKERALKREQDAIKKTQDAETAKTNAAIKNSEREQSVTDTKSARGAAIKVQQAGYQVADFATQISGGTSALVSLSQQLPQFLGAFGPQGAVAGALIAVGLTAYKVFSGIGDSMEKAKERADFLAKAITEGAALAAKALTEDYDMGASALSNAQTIASALEQKFKDIAKAQGEFALSSLKNTASLNAAEVRLQELMGKRYDQQQMTDFLAQEQAAIRKKEYDERIREQNQIIANAEKEKEKTESALALKRTAFSEQQKSLAADELELESIKKRKAALEDLAASKVSYFKIATAEMADMPGLLQQRKEATAAESQLKGSEFVARIPILEASIKELQAQVSATGAATKALDEAMIAAETARIDVETKSQEVNLKVSTLTDAFNLEGVMAGITKIEEEGKAKAETITKLIQGVNPETTGEKQAMEFLTTAVSDHQIQVGEAQKTAAALATLSSKIAEANSGQTQVISSLITSVQKMKMDSDAQQRRIDNLQGAKTTPPKFN